MGVIHSKYLNKDIDVPLQQRQEGDRILQIIPHDALEDIVNNQVPQEYGLTYDFNIVNSSIEHSVVICVMLDNNGRRVVELGESVPGTLESDISKSYPTLMAAQRAFDRAAIKYLNLPGKVFSNIEADINESGAALNVTKASETTGIQSTAVEEPKTESGPIPAPIEKKDENGSAKKPTAENKPAEQTAPENPAPEPEKKNPGDIMMKVGSEKNKLTVAQTFEKNISSIAWVRKHIKPTKPESTETLQAIEDYLAENKEAKEKYEKYVEEHPEYKIVA